MPNALKILKHNTIVYLVLVLLNFRLSIAACVDGLDGCLICADASSCLKCQNRYRLTSNYGCRHCSVLHCFQCYPEHNRCSVAQPGYGVHGFYYTYHCHIYNCFNCDNNNLQCNQCFPSFKLTSNNLCQPCLVSDCNKCANDVSICTQCNQGFYLSGNLCTPNNVQNCQYSSVFGQCSLCKDRFGLVSGLCQPCADRYCKKCSSDPNKCTQCQPLFGLTNTNSCTRCHDPLCVTCGQDASVCKDCFSQDNLGLSDAGQCVACSSLQCYYCHKNASLCQSCQQLHGVAPDGSCILCQDTNCQSCSWSYSFCTACIPLYGFNLTDSNKTCTACQNQYCLNCSESHVQCRQCIEPLGKDGLGGCLPCHDIQCTECSDFYLTCTACVDGTGLSNISTFQLCQQSPSLCLECNTLNLYQCYSCPNGSALNIFSVCQACPQYCTQCFYNAAGLIQCTSCIQNTAFLRYIIVNLLCIEHVCSNLIYNAATQQCDKGLDISHDGCQNNCSQSDNFTCWADGSQSLCSFTGVLQMGLVCFDCNPKYNQNYQNEYEIMVSVFPPLHIFSLSDESELKELFRINDERIVVKSIAYSPDTGTLRFICEINSNIRRGSNIEIVFSPDRSSNPEHSLTPSSTLWISVEKTYYYISSSDITLSNIVLYVCYALVALFWLAFLLGVLLKRLAGLEAMFVLQVAYMSFFLLPSNMLITFEQTHPLRFSAGYNHAFVAEQPADVPSEHAPYFSQFHFSQRLLANNFNLCMLLQLISLIIMVVNKKRLMAFLEHYQPEEQKQAEQQSQSQSLKQLNKFIAQYELSYQLLMSSCMLNLMPFVLCLTLFFRHGQVLHIPSLVILSTQLIILVATLIKFVCDPSPFDYFRFSFGIAELQMRHYCLVVLVLVSTVALMIMLDNLPYACLVPAVLMLVYTLAYRPYKQLSENLRSGWNWLAVSSLLFYRVFVGMLCEEQDLNKTVASVYFMVNVLVVLPVTVGMAIVFVVYYYWYYNYKCQEESKQQKQTKQNKKSRSVEIEQYRKRLLGQLVKINPNIQIKDVKQESTFRELINPHSSLLKAANKLKIFRQTAQQRLKQKQEQNYESKDLEQFKKEVKQANNNNVLGKNINGIFATSLQRMKENSQENHAKYNKIKKQINYEKEQIRNPKASNHEDENSNQISKVMYQQLIYKQFNIQFNEDGDGADKNNKRGQNKQVLLKIYNEIMQQNELRNGCNQQEEQICKKIVNTQEVKKYLATNIMKEEEKYINLRSAFELTKKFMKEQISKQILQEYDMIDNFYNAHKNQNRNDHPAEKRAQN